MSKIFEIGQIISGKFKIINNIGKGGFGRTYLAEEIGDFLSEICVIKHLDTHILGPNVHEKIKREALALKEFGIHPQIPSYKDSFVFENEVFLAMEFIDGETLEKQIQKHKYNEKKVIDLLMEILSLLDFIHGKNKIHRDIKPANIIIRSNDKKPVLIDFGGIKEISMLTSRGLSSLGYTAKEQLLGKAKSNSDIFSLGKTAIYCLTRFHPHEIIDRNVEVDQPEDNWERFASKMTPELAKIINKSIEAEHINRYHSAKEMLEDLKALVSNNVFANEDSIFVDEYNGSLLSKELNFLLQDDFNTSNAQNNELDKKDTKDKFAFPTSKLRFKYAFFNKKDVLEKDGKGKQITVKINEEVDLELVWIHAGSFLDFSITDFFLGKYPVTQRQWKAVALLPQITRKLNPMPSFFKDDNLPVERVSWKDAIEFCARISHRTGKNFRLPTEIEWEYACRGKSETTYFCGDRIDERWATFFEVNQNKGTRKVTETIYPNKFGLFDMLGNVWEWCYDEWSNNYINLVRESFSTKYRVRKGGSWQNSVKDCRCSRRSRANNNLRNYITGFRVAADNR